MKVWLSCFFVLFAIAEFYQWAQHLSIPLPFYIFGGAVLAVASNTDKRLGFFLPLKDEVLALLQIKQSNPKEPE
ncbi:hypothetical protein [Chlorogloea sp. CCALA 695]|uniref:hypothetical protein n=1 Tax=Chlorogloea sp. CCALA 695 TaxID=2107693 RepID=UPI000D085AC4|nr:hypothetical protein [Chlorogloea sp. CCALA 695]PSB32535.1 hypothetical protein C7B70_09875 [Chlorogloea sp. CCALA 695]